MVRITNTHKVTPLGLPGFGLINPGETKAVPNWHAIKDNRVVAAWVGARMLVVEGETETVAAAQPEVVADEKDALITALAELGIEKDRRSSVASLQAALAEARAATGEAEESNPDEG